MKAADGMAMSSPSIAPKKPVVLRWAFGEATVAAKRLPLSTQEAFTGFNGGERI